MLFDDTLPAKSLEGQCIGPYQVSARIGAGGMGEVYRARDTKLNRDVAIKVLLPDASPTIPTASRGSVGKRRSSRHSIIRTSPQIYGLEDAGGLHALGHGAGRRPDARRSDRARARFRSTRRCRSRSRSPRRSQAAHEQGIIHRDLKPANIKVTRGRHGEGAGLRAGEGFRADAATHASDLRIADDRRRRRDDRRWRHPRARPAYMSPEQARGQAVGQADGHLGVRLRALRDADAAARVRRRDRVRHARRDSEREPDWATLPADRAARRFAR